MVVSHCGCNLRHHATKFEVKIILYQGCLQETGKKEAVNGCIDKLVAKYPKCGHMSSEMDVWPL